jgi:beta-1,4-mannosyltransferase
VRVAASPAFKTREFNPYPWLLYSNIQAHVDEVEWSVFQANKYEIVHVHWPDHDLNVSKNQTIVLVRICIKLLVIDRFRANGAKLIWTMHNLGSHERLHPRLESWFWRQFISRLDGVIALSEAGLELARQQFPAVAALPQFVIPHGHYRDEYPNDDTLDAREALGIKPGAKVLLYFGSIRPYKNVSRLIELFRELPGENAVLYIVGRSPSAEVTQQLQALADLDHRVHLNLSFVSKDRVQLYFRAADLVVLPYQEILNSGSAILALSFNRPVLVPRLGAMSELARSVGNDWVQTYSGDIKVKVLEQSLEWAMNTVRPRLAPLERLDWREISTKTIKAFEYLLQKKGGDSLA